MGREGIGSNYEGGKGWTWRLAAKIVKGGRQILRSLA